MTNQFAPIKVLVVDDSAVARGIISKVLSASSKMLVVGFCKDGTEVVAAVEKLRPDVITLDVEMPRLKGTTILKHVLSKHPIPVIMVSSMTPAGAQITLDCLAMGAFDFILKPGAIQFKGTFAEYSEELSSKVLAAGSAARSRARLRTTRKTLDLHTDDKGSFKIHTQSNSSRIVGNAVSQGILVIGASTGGPSAVANLLNRLPVGMPPVLVAIHMPAPFTTLYADRLSRSIKTVHVKLAEDGERLSAGTAYIAPGDQHLQVVCTENQEIFARLDKATSTDLYKPSIDKLFNSVALAYDNAALACVLTGMGSDGALGAAEIFKRGGVVFSQDEHSSAIYGMPKVVFENGHSHRQVSLQDLPQEIAQTIHERFSK